MSKFKIYHAEPIFGEVEISGAKNAVLPLMASALMSDGKCELQGVPALKDVEVMGSLLRSIGAEVVEDFENGRIEIRGEISAVEAPLEPVRQMRASIAVMGPLLAKAGRAKVPLPGGCAIGARPIGLHLKGFKALGAVIKESAGFVEARADRLKGANIYLDFPSVGATENIIMAAVLADGATVLENAAEEPEIVDLANFLNKMGAKIKGAGTDTIKIEGVERLGAAKHTVIPDRIETGTFMIAAAITRGRVSVKNMVPDHVKPIIAKLRECGVEVEEFDDSVLVDAEGKELVATEIKTLPYPGFPTDMQPQFMSLLTTVKGSSAIIETVFERRYRHVGELNRMGARITTEGNLARIPGGTKLVGAKVLATDLRAGAAMALAGMAAKGVTEISEIFHIERGYSDFMGKLGQLGVRIERKAD
ncbi:MAG: UDP-N-acetylglucosamine 1-carboxyvinyltransferase [Clostridiales Family XIII bacterium]|nr:UDP-N-acetylglucosamine 1-carboxyvinyltransferase [Clostridiales Family XIII bacterium]